MKILAVLTIVGSMVLGAARSSNATPGFRGGHNCLELGPSPQSLIWRGSSNAGFYVYNGDQVSSKALACPVTVESASMNPTTSRVDFDDFSTVDDIACTPWLEDDAVFTSLGIRYSCATAGGCTSPNLTWSGVGNLSWADTIGSVSGELAASFSCSLGRADPGGDPWMMIRRYEFAH